MVPNGSAYSNYPSFANNGTKTPPGGSTESAKYALGMVPADTFPAEWANYLFHGATAGITRLNLDTASIKKELNSILAAYNITNDASAYNQLLTALGKIYPQMCECVTAAATAAKTIALQGNVLKAGCVYVIEMTYGNTAASPTLSINGGTAYPICDCTGRNAGVGAWAAGDTIKVLFTGTKFIMAALTTNKIENGNQLAVTSNAVSCVMATNTTIQNAPILGIGGVVKIMFTADVVGSDTTTGMTITYNGETYPVKVNKNGSLIAFKAFNIYGTPKYLQAYTVLEFIFDGTNLIINGNPLVLSGINFTIYADGKHGVEIVGDVKAKATTDIPYGWLPCDGRSVSRADYPDLFERFNTQTYDTNPNHTLLSRYGSVDSLHFNLPDYREVALVGIGTNDIDSIQTHDIYTIGEFKDDCDQRMTGKFDAANGITPLAIFEKAGGVFYQENQINSTVNHTTGGASGYTISFDNARSVRTGSVSRGKRKGVIYIIKVLY